MFKKSLIIFLLFIFQILEIDNQCSKETPIYKNDECMNIYCSEIEYQNENCTIKNSVIKTQWLNKLFDLGDNIINELTVIEMPNNNILFLSYECDGDYLYIYSLNSSDEIYYNETNDNFKKISISSLSPSGQKYFLYDIKGVGLIIDNKEFLFICQFIDINYQYQLIEFENDIIFKDNITFLNISRRVYDYTILNLSKKNYILLSWSDYQYFGLSIINIKKEDEIYYGIDIVNSIRIPQSYYYDYPINCFETEKTWKESYL